MTRLISSLQRSAFFTGCLIWVFIASTIPRTAAACPAPATEAEYLAWSGQPFQSWTACMQTAWAETENHNKTVAQSAFGVDHTPGLFYRLFDMVDGPGIYSGFAHDGTMFSLVIFVSSEPLTQDSDGQPFEGNGGGRSIVGEMQGPAGSIGVTGLLVYTTRTDGTFDQMLLIDTALSASQTQTWRTTGYLAIAAKNPATTTENETAFMSTSGQSQAEVRNCLKPELFTALGCISGAMAIFAACMKLVNVTKIKAMISCTASTIGIPLFGVAAAALCIAAIIALRIKAENACRAALTAALKACLGGWATDIAECKLQEMVGW